MSMLFRRAALAACLVLPALATARADCAYDIGQAKARLAFETDKVRAALVRKLLAKAEDERRVAESECRNDVTRAWRVLKAPPEEVARQPNQPNYSTLNRPNGLANQ